MSVPFFLADNGFERGGFPLGLRMSIPWVVFLLLLQEIGWAQDGEAPVLFRSGVDLVRLDATVTDGQGNPVKNLTPEDFEIIERGQRREIQFFRHIERSDGGDGLEEVPVTYSDILNPERHFKRTEVRLIVVFFDDYHVHGYHDAKVQEFLEKFLNALGPHDLVALMVPLTPMARVVPIKNRALLRAQIESLRGVKGDYRVRNIYEDNYASFPEERKREIRAEVSLGALKGLMSHLGTLREEHKSVVLISEGYPEALASNGGSWRSRMPQLGSFYRWDRDEMEVNVLDNLLRETAQEARKWNTSIYPIHPGERTISLANLSGPSAPLIPTTNSGSTLRMLAGMSGGNYVGNHDLGLEYFVRDTGSYYLLGYRPEGEGDGFRGEGFRQVQVRVRRRGLNVRAREFYWTPGQGPTSSPTTGGRLSALNSRLRGALGELLRQTRSGVRFWFGVSKNSEGEAKLDLALEATPKLHGSAGENLAFSLTVESLARDQMFFDGEIETAGEGEAFASVPVVPGDIAIRALVEGDGGILYEHRQNIHIPDFGSVPLSISTPTIHRARNHYFLQRVLNGFGQPSASRKFFREETLVIRFDVYTIGLNNAESVTARLLSGANGHELSPLEIERRDSNSYQITLPLSHLAPATYVVELTAEKGERKARRLWAFDL